jgi:hypothetical protein
MENQIEIYRSSDGQPQIDVLFGKETVWLNRNQLADLFGRDVKTIGKHVNNVFFEGELEKSAVVANIATTAADGKIYQVDHYNLDVIISVGYRVKSQQGTQFRQWATQRLKDYLIQGYAINEKRLNQKQQEVQTLKDGIRILSRAIETKMGDADLTLLDQFAKGLELLDDYDHEKLDPKGITTRQAKYPELSDYQNIIESMRRDFDSEIFGKEKDDSFQGSVAQISKGLEILTSIPQLKKKPPHYSNVEQSPSAGNVYHVGSASPLENDKSLESLLSPVKDGEYTPHPLEMPKHKKQKEFSIGFDLVNNCAYTTAQRKVQSKK